MIESAELPATEHLSCEVFQIIGIKQVDLVCLPHELHRRMLAYIQELQLASVGMRPSRRIIQMVEGTSHDELIGGRR